MKNTINRLNEKIEIKSIPIFVFSPLSFGFGIALLSALIFEIKNVIIEFGIGFTIFIILMSISMIISGYYAEIYNEEKKTKK